MRVGWAMRMGAGLLAAGLLASCDRLGLASAGHQDDGAPGEQQLQRISYMSADDPGNGRRKLYSHPEEAQSCGDFELAMRWNRPPGVAGGPFHQKMIYLTAGIPADLPKDSEVFVSANIERGAMTAQGSAGWYLRMADGTRVQAVETASFWEQQQQAPQTGKAVALVKPTKPGRAFCGHAVYQGRIGKDPDQAGGIPFLSMLYSMDRGT
ncbi:MAG TPA: hypothetical protein VJQ47_14190 [Steroidobacteraceae bacterium]|nr:hypothetical protein [Steroidobacteraceae bacterium]